MCSTTEIGDCSLVRRDKANLPFGPGELELEAQDDLKEVLACHSEAATLFGDEESLQFRALGFPGEIARWPSAPGGRTLH